MSQDQQPKPLWQLLEEAHRNEAGSIILDNGQEELAPPDNETRAAEIIAFRDFMLSRLAKRADIYPWQLRVINELLRTEAETARRAKPMPKAPPTRTVNIPGCVEHGGWNGIRVTVPWICPVCGGPRGEIYRTTSYDGSRRLSCDGWQNPCGHIDKYADVKEEAIKFYQALQEGIL